jgi:hypothetical protein
MSQRHVRLACVLLAAFVPSACFEERERQMKQVSQDEAVLKSVTAAVNQVVRNAADCDAARAAMPEARQKLSEAFGQVKEEVSQQTLRVLDAQLKRVADACP